MSKIVYENQNFELKKLLERKIGEIKSKIDGSLSVGKMLSEVVKCVRLADDVNVDAWRRFGGIMFRILRC